MDKPEDQKSSSDSSSSRFSGNLLANRLAQLGIINPPIGRGRGVVPRVTPSSSPSVGISSSSSSQFDRQALLKSLSSKSSSDNDSHQGVYIDTSKIVSDVGRGRARLLASLNPNIRLSNPGVVPVSEPKPLQGFSASAIEEPSTAITVPVQVECRTSPQSLQSKSIEDKGSVQDEQPKQNTLGSSGTSMQFTCNYVKLKLEANMGVYEYEVKFSSEIDSKGLKIQLLNQHLQELGGVKTFDGVTLYLPILLDKKIFTSINPLNKTPVELQIIFKKKKSLGECVHLYNVLFRRIMNCLELVAFNRQHFDPAAAKIIPQHQLEIWPGYVTAVNEYDDGIMLCLDVSHRVLRQQTVLNFLSNLARSDKNNIINNAKAALIGSHVLTRYNNRSYRIDDLDFNMSPMSTFENSQGNKITFCEYYKKQYNIDILDLHQPLLISNCSVQVSGYSEPVERKICLLPELAYLTGISEDMRKNMKIMRDIATYTKITPNQRIYGLRKFLQNVNNNKTATQLLSSWGLSLHDDCFKLLGRTLDPEMILFSGASVSATKNASWGLDCTRNRALECIDLLNWVIIYSKQDQQVAINFKDCAKRCGPPMGIAINEPMLIGIANDKTDTYVQQTHKVMRENKRIQIIVYIFPTMRDDRYSAIKKICCVEYGIASQVINARTLSMRDKLRSVVQKITLQVNCKLGGTLWGVNIPLKNTMICGIDTYHDPGSKLNSVIGFVSSLNQSCTKYYNQVGFQTPRDELGQSMKVLFQKALKRYFDVNGAFPSKVICYRDGIGDGQFKHCQEVEITMMQECFNTEVFADNKPTLIYIIVQKRINTRFIGMINNEFVNPSPGSIIDHSITKKNMYDFFLVPQNVTQGTVSPSHYIILQDYSNLKPDHIQRLSFKLCHLYYNWPGTVRVPACCQYAHKLAYLIGQHVKSKPNRKLEDYLFYL